MANMSPEKVTMAQDIAAVSKPAGSGKFIGITIVIFVIIKWGYIYERVSTIALSSYFSVCHRMSDKYSDPHLFINR